MILRSVVSVAAFAALLGPCDLMNSSQPPGPVFGTWGGENAGLMADDTSAHVHIGCTYGNVHQQIVPDPSGKFDVPGEHNITAHPVDRGILHPARSSGRWMDDAGRDAHGYGSDARSRAARLWQGATDGAVSYLQSPQTQLSC